MTKFMLIAHAESSGGRAATANADQIGGRGNVRLTPKQQTSYERAANRGRGERWIDRFNRSRGA